MHYTKGGNRQPEDYSKAQMQREYAIDKQQRNYENRIRQLKQEERQLRACGMEKEASAVRKKWRRLTKDYQIYSVENNRAYYPYRYVIDRTETQGLTESASDVIITNENIKRSLGEKVVTLQEAINNANPLVVNAFERYQKNLKIIDAHYKGTAFFDPDRGGIRFNLETTSRGSQGRKPFTSYFHETGHNIDFLIGKKFGGGYASEGYKSPSYSGKSFGQMIWEEGHAFLETYREFVAKKKEDPIVTNEEVYLALCEEFKGSSYAQLEQLSDILDGLTKGELKKLNKGFGWGHPDGYWDNHPLALEAFANFTSAFATDPKMAEMLMHIFPNSYDIYREILEL